MTENLNVIPGDKVSLRIGQSDSFNFVRVMKVGRFIELENGARYRLDGTPVGSNLNRNSITIVTEEILQIMKKEKLVGKLSRLNYNDWKRMELSQLEALVAIIEGEKDVTENP